jgi:hypothetical protein
MIALLYGPAGKVITHVASINYAACDEGGLIALHWYFEDCQGLEINLSVEKLKIGIRIFIIHRVTGGLFITCVHV